MGAGRKAGVRSFSAPTTNALWRSNVLFQNNAFTPRTHRTHFPGFATSIRPTSAKPIHPLLGKFNMEATIDFCENN
jgi:hypothetical protein